MDIRDYGIREGTVIRVIDGDTVDVLAEVGYDTQRKVRIRFEGTNTAEMKDDAEYGKAMAKRARAYVINKVLNKRVVVQSEGFKSGGFGRYLGRVFYQQGDQWIDLSQDMIDQGLAHVYTLGASKRPYID